MIPQWQSLLGGVKQPTTNLSGSQWTQTPEINIPGVPSVQTPSAPTLKPPSLPNSKNILAPGSTNQWAGAQGGNTPTGYQLGDWTYDGGQWWRGYSNPNAQGGTNYRVNWLGDTWQSRVSGLPNSAWKNASGQSPFNVSQQDLWWTPGNVTSGNAADLYNQIQQYQNQQAQQQYMSQFNQAQQQWQDQWNAAMKQWQDQQNAYADSLKAAQSAADAKALAEKEGRMNTRRAGLNSSGLMPLVQQLYGDDTEGLNSYLETGIFGKQPELQSWSEEQMGKYSGDLNKNYADTIGALQRAAGARNVGNWTGWRDVENALSAQRGDISGYYNDQLDASKLLATLQGDPAKMTAWYQPQLVSDLGQGVKGFMMLDPRLSTLIKGGVDEAPVKWMPQSAGESAWASLFDQLGETEQGNEKKGLLADLFAQLLGSGVM